MIEIRKCVLIGMLLLVPAGHDRLAAAPALTRLDVVEGTTATYRVREQLARMNTPVDAVGTTQVVTGALVLGPDNTIQTDQSKLTVDLSTLKTDQDRRDNYVRRRTLETERFPHAVFVPKRVEGLPSPLPSSGEARFQLIGEMTIHGVTSEITWDVAATFSAGEVTGKATTKFPFGKFGLTKPSVMVVLSVEDEIRLELDFRLKKSAN